MRFDFVPKLNVRTLFASQPLYDFFSSQTLMRLLFAVANTVSIAFENSRHLVDFSRAVRAPKIYRESRFSGRANSELRINLCEWRCAKATALLSYASNSTSSRFPSFLFAAPMSARRKKLTTKSAPKVRDSTLERNAESVRTASIDRLQHEGEKTKSPQRKGLTNLSFPVAEIYLAHLRRAVRTMRK